MRGATRFPRRSPGFSATRKPQRRHGRACPGHPRFAPGGRTWMPGTSPGMTISQIALSMEESRYAPAAFLAITLR
ncbi:hypothetical protein XH96_12965 [Bradyrhizobium sp. CCBAU 51765]|nr:hypothetical protein XH96_12965 [Bradyrhizobium sp. CCBAU 51765]